MRHGRSRFAADIALVCVCMGGGLMPLLFMTHCTLFAFAAESESDGNTWVAIVVAPECVVSPRQYARTDGVV